MSNRLTKNTNITYTPGSPGIAASPGTPYVRARTVYVDQQVCGYVPTGSSGSRTATTTYIQDNNGNWQTITQTQGGVASMEYRCSTQRVPVYYPAQPSTPPTAGVPATAETFTYDFNLGWNAGARSQGFFPGDGYAAFDVSPSLVAVVAGLNYTDPDADYVNIDYAFYLSGGVARIMEMGEEKAYAGPYASTARFKIDRRRGVVRYYIGDALVYTSSTPSFGTAFLDVSMYSGGDYLISPAIAPYSYVERGSEPYETDGALNLRPMAMSAGAAGRGYARLVMRPITLASSLAAPVGASAAMRFEPAEITGGTFVSGTTANPTTRADVALRALTLSSNPFQGGTLNLLPMTSYGANYVSGSASVAFSALTLDSRPRGMVPAYALASLPMAGLSVSGTCLTGEIGGGAQIMSPLNARGGRAGYGDARMTSQALTMYGSANEGNTAASMRELVVSRAPITFFGFVEVRLFSSATASDELLTLVIKDAAVAESASVAGTMTYSAIMQALMRVNVQVFAGVPISALDGETWVVNDATGASTTYEGYSFNSFAKYQGKYLAAKADGVYLLGGDTDAGDPIRASISLGKQDFGTTAMKTVSNCYVGVSSAGDVFLKIIANGTEHLYKTVRCDDYTRTQRIATGRGLRASYMTFELFNEAGAAFELASVEFEAAVLSRRI